LSQIDPLLLQAPDALRALTALPAALGADGSRDYLVVPQNSRDLRATGGFIGTVGILHIDHGRARMLDFQNSYEVDANHRPNVDQPLPLRSLGWLPWYFRDANWSADYPTSARLLEAFYQLGTHRKVDGVIAFDDQLLPGLFNALGPVTVPGYSETLTPANAFDRLNYYVNLRGPVDKAFALAAYRAVFARLVTVSGGTARNVLDVVRQSVRTHHILLYANAPDLQSAASLVGADGAIRETTGDYLYLVDTNTSTNKVAQLVQRTITYKAVIQPDRSILATAAITYTSAADANNVPWRDGWTKFADFVRLYAPPGSTLLWSKGLDEARWPTMDLHNKTQFSGYFALEAHRTRTITFHYRIPANADPGASYTLLVQKQPGTPATPVNLAISSTGDVRVDGTGLPTTAVLDSDLSVTAPLSGGQPHTLRLAPVTAEPDVSPGSHPEPWVTVPSGWVSIPDWAEVRTGNGWCVRGSRKVCHVPVVVHKS
jgi:hypothetical protein